MLIGRRIVRSTFHARKSHSQIHLDSLPLRTLLRLNQSEQESASQFA